MESDWDLKQLKEKYNVLQSKYGLPSFEELNEDFQVEKAADSETEFILREIRKYITDKFFNYLRFIESILNPVNAPMFVFAVTKIIGEKDREKLRDLYKKIAKVDIELVELDLKYSEEKEAESIKRNYKLWQEIKKDLLGIIDMIKKNWDNKIGEDTKGYFG